MTRPYWLSLVMMAGSESSWGAKKTLTKAVLPSAAVAVICFSLIFSVAPYSLSRARVDAHVTYFLVLGAGQDDTGLHG